MAQSSGVLNKHAASYSRTYVSPSATVNLSNEVSQARHPCSSMFIIATADTTFTYKDCAGVSNALVLKSGNILPLNNVAASTLEASATCIILVTWHP